jgi:hypothetical protein
MRELDVVRRAREICLAHRGLSKVSGGTAEPVAAGLLAVSRLGERPSGPVPLPESARAVSARAHSSGVLTFSNNAASETGHSKVSSLVMKSCILRSFR